jgi:hypothetical protein
MPFMCPACEAFGTSRGENGIRAEGRQDKNSPGEGRQPATICAAFNFDSLIHLISPTDNFNVAGNHEVF